jgi:hypothetical protein
MNRGGNTAMFRLLDASIALNNWAVALNIFALWALSAGVAAVILAAGSRRSREMLAAQSLGRGL